MNLLKISRFYPIFPRFFTTFPRKCTFSKFFKVRKCERCGSLNPLLVYIVSRKSSFELFLHKINRFVYFIFNYSNTFYKEGVSIFFVFIVFIDILKEKRQIAVYT